MYFESVGSFSYLQFVKDVLWLQKWFFRSPSATSRKRYESWSNERSLPWKIIETTFILILYASCWILAKPNYVKTFLSFNHRARILNTSIDFAKQYVDVPEKIVQKIKHCRKFLLFYQRSLGKTKTMRVAWTWRWLVMTQLKFVNF